MAIGNTATTSLESWERWLAPVNMGEGLRRRLAEVGRLCVEVGLSLPDVFLTHQDASMAVYGVRAELIWKEEDARRIFPTDATRPLSRLCTVFDNEGSLHSIESVFIPISPPLPALRAMQARLLDDWDWHGK